MKGERERPSYLQKGVSVLQSLPLNQVFTFKSLQVCQQNFWYLKVHLDHLKKVVDI